MTKSELVKKVAAELKDVTKGDAKIVIDTIFSSMSKALVSGDKIEIRGFGSFKVKKRNARMGRNPKTGQSVEITAKRIPYFKVGKDLKERVNKFLK
jgi:integration host factor subunit beta